MQSENLHAGHRSRMIKKCSDINQKLTEHELLEVLLYFSIPRKDVNPLAHKLLRTFGSIKNVFSATAEQLKTVDGIGDYTAALIVAIGRLNKDYKISNRPLNKSWKTPYDAMKQLSSLFNDVEKERLCVVFLTRDFKEINALCYDGENEESLEIDSHEIVATLSALHPKYVLLAHNHPSNNVKPSLQDDVTTAKMNTLCSAHDAELLDHYIVCRDGMYSYRRDPEDRLKTIKEKSDFINIYKNLEEHMHYDKQ